MVKKLTYTDGLISVAAKILKRDNKRLALEVLTQSTYEIDKVTRQISNDDYETFDAVQFDLPFEIYTRLKPNLNNIKEEIRDAISEALIDRNESYAILVAIQLRATDDWRLEIHSLSNSAFGIPILDSRYEADVFMLMPFSDEDIQHVYQDHVRNVLKSFNYTVKRGDDFFTDKSVISDIWSAINSAKLIIADCTHRNPNVFYELGIAHAVGKPTILITSDIDDMPFDLRHQRFIEYQYKPRAMIDFEVKLKEAIQSLLPQPPQPHSHHKNFEDIPF